MEIKAKTTSLIGMIIGAVGLSEAVAGFFQCEGVTNCSTESSQEGFSYCIGVSHCRSTAPTAFTQCYADFYRSIPVGRDANGGFNEF